MIKSHFLILTFPAQGHINPALQFAKRLVRHGALVTFVTTVSAFRRMSRYPDVPESLSMVSFSDGHDDGFKSSSGDPSGYRSEFYRRCTETLAELIRTGGGSDGTRVPFTCLVYTLAIPCVAMVGREFHIPSALLWIQPATVFDIYYYYFNGHRDVVHDETRQFIDLPGLPQLERRDMPSFILPTNPYVWSQASIKAQFEALDGQENPRILVNTFNALEPEALTAISRFRMLAIGPLMPSALLGRVDSNDTTFGADLFKGLKEDYREWLDSKAEGSVVYVSFGTIAVVSKPQMEEIARGLVEMKRPFLWVLTDKESRGEEKDEDKLSAFREELEKEGLILPWCSQLEVLSHPSIGCFLTHCGWNSTFESLVCGVPTVAFPQWTDQTTNAKLIQDTMKTGVRVIMNEEGIVKSKEIKRCLGLVMEERAEEFRMNAKKWKDLAFEASQEGGSSHQNLKIFLDELQKV